ncbi:hypothetical protein KY311_02495 [Candidatus Woesearchaeota archaeon]|nr:hypothetical protein [Candidatus Woesearchaeota archaeon]
MAIDNAVQKMLGAYSKYKERNAQKAQELGHFMLALDMAEKEILGLRGKLLTLNPEQIKEFVKHLTAERADFQDTALRPLFITRAIQDAYDAGYSEFEIDTGDAPVPNLGYKLEAIQGKVLRIKVNGKKGTPPGELFNVLITYSE